MSAPKRVIERFRATIKNYTNVLRSQRDRDVSEADTVTIVKDILQDVFGYDKYAEVTSELAIRCTYCDLAIKIDGKPNLLIEVKAIGLNLNEKHTKQAVDYAANQGVDWVVLTNGIRWILYHVLFKKPIEQSVVADIDLLSLNVRAEDDIEKLYILSKEGLTKGAISEYRQRKDATNRYVIAAVLLNSEDVLGVIRREVRRVTNVLVDQEEISKVLREDVIKREALEGAKADEAHRRTVRRSERSLRAESEREIDSSRAESSVAAS